MKLAARKTVILNNRDCYIIVNIRARRMPDKCSIFLRPMLLKRGNGVRIERLPPLTFPRMMDVMTVTKVKIPMWSVRVVLLA